MYGWGYNGNGQLGNDLKTTPVSPVLAVFPSGVTATSIAAGGYHSLAIGSDGNLYGWGYNAYGQLGDGETTEHNKPQLVSMPSGVRATALAAGLYHSLAIGSNGKLYAWGYNLYGQIGDGTTTNQLLPEAINLPSGGTPNAITAGQYDSLALLPSGSSTPGVRTASASWASAPRSTQASPTQVVAPPYTAFVASGIGIRLFAHPGRRRTDQTSTTTALSAAVTSPTYGQSETLTAVVTGSDGGGTVAFADGASPISGCSAVALSRVGSNYQRQPARPRA